MKKCFLTLAAIGIMLVVASGAWAYSMTFSSILTDSPGKIQLDVGVWDPNDNVVGNTYYGTGFWGYVFDIKNISYDTYLTDVVIAKLPTTTVIDVFTPAGWLYVPHPGTFGWTSSTGGEIYTGSTKTGFEVKSTQWPSLTQATGWTGFYSPAYGQTLGPSVVPEPASMSLLGLGLFGLIGGVIRKKVKA